jgi:hypothetical protein
MKNIIQRDINKQRKGMYQHCLEVDSAYQLDSIVDELVNDFLDVYCFEDIVEFFMTLSIYPMDIETERDVHNYNMRVKMQDLDLIE